MKYATLLAGAAVAATALVGVAPVKAETKWWPTKYYNLDSGSPQVAEYVPLEKASKPWNICVLFPHMKDTFWVAVDYGVVEEARRMGVNMTLYQAGGYENLPKQLSQFDDCLSGNFDAIVIGPISEAGLDKQFAKGVASGKVIISTVNPVAKSTVTSKMTVDFDTMGEQTGKYLVDYLKEKSAKVGTFPGPSGSGWAEAFLDGFKKAVKGKSNITMLDDKFGDFWCRRAAWSYPECLAGLSGYERDLGLRSGRRSRRRRGGSGRKERHADHVVVREPSHARRVEQR